MALPICTPLSLATLSPSIQKATCKVAGGAVWKFVIALQMSGRKLATELGVTPSFLSKVERGTEALSPEMARLILSRYAEGCAERTS